MDILKESRDIIEAINKAMENYLYEKEPSHLYNAVKHLPLAGGKRLRPLVAYLACEALDGDGMKTIPFGVALEFIHTFTLIHDDIMDRDEMRRGMPAVHKEYGENAAILAGDTLFAKAFEAVSMMKNDAVVKRLTKNLSIMAKEICEGQALDVEFEGVEYIDEPMWFEMIEKKTARMFEHAAMGGAIVANASEKQIETMRKYGLNLGMAFQIWDDCLDVIGKDIGKPVGSDIREGKKTLMYLHSYKIDKEALKDYGKEASVDKIIEIFEKNGSIEYAKNIAYEHSKKAIDAIKEIKDSKAKHMLIELAKFAVEREK
ncbi:MAG: polyprenyl synthetase family protein [Thermoplasmata archaeon]|nr:polyprenyl synthetase family protein [Thermoplasmata archaeon]